jgi:hypothetical protein
MGCDSLQIVVDNARARCSFGLERCQRLQQENRRFREPERTILCDILANGTLLPDPSGTRYARPDVERVVHSEPEEHDREGEIAAILLAHSYVQPDQPPARVLREADFGKVARAILARQEGQ